MSFDINETIGQMANAIKGSLQQDWSAAKDAVNTYLNNRKARLELLADMRIQGQIDDGFMKKRLADEEVILESELHSIAILTKAAAQHAANAAIDVLEKAITAAAKIVL